MSLKKRRGLRSAIVGAALLASSVGIASPANASWADCPSGASGRWCYWAGSGSAGIPTTFSSSSGGYSINVGSYGNRRSGTAVNWYRTNGTFVNCVPYNYGNSYSTTAGSHFFGVSC